MTPDNPEKPKVIIEVHTKPINHKNHWQARIEVMVDGKLIEERLGMRHRKKETAETYSKAMAENYLRELDTLYRAELYARARMGRRYVKSSNAD